MTMTSYTKRCTRSRRVCWCKFGWNPTRSFSVICNLLSLSLIQRQAVFLHFACLFIHCLDTGPELYACLSIYENAETLSLPGIYKECEQRSGRRGSKSDTAQVRWVKGLLKPKGSIDIPGSMQQHLSHDVHYHWMTGKEVGLGCVSVALLWCSAPRRPEYDGSIEKFTPKNQVLDLGG